MKRFSQGTVTLMLGVMLLTITYSGIFTRYVKPSLGPYLYLTGAVLILLGAATALARTNDEDHHQHGDSVGGQPHPPAHQEPVPATSAVVGDGCGHDHEDGPRAGWLMLAPLLCLALVVPPALGADAAKRDTGIVAQTGSPDQVEMPDGDPADINVAQYQYFAATDGGKALEGRTVRMVGFSVPEADGTWYLTRMAMSCCAADGYAIKVKVQGWPAPPANNWVQVIGKNMPQNLEDPWSAPPVMTVDSVIPTQIPADPYL